jgi:hypothetical protein
MKYQKAMEKIYKNKHINKQNTLFSQLCLDLILGLMLELLLLFLDFRFLFFQVCCLPLRGQRFVDIPEMVTPYDKKVQ